MTSSPTGAVYLGTVIDVAAVMLEPAVTDPLLLIDPPLVLIDPVLVIVPVLEMPELVRVPELVMAPVLIDPGLKDPVIDRDPADTLPVVEKLVAEKPVLTDSPEADVVRTDELVPFVLMVTPLVPVEKVAPEAEPALDENEVDTVRLETVTVVLDSVVTVADGLVSVEAVKVSTEIAPVLLVNVIYDWFVFEVDAWYLTPNVTVVDVSVTSRPEVGSDARTAL